MPDVPDRGGLPAADKRQARVQRIRDLRVQVAAIAVALFICAWAGLYIQLVSGNDPALAGTVAPVSQPADPDATDDGSDDGASDDSTSAGDAYVDATQSQTSSEPAPVTSGQS